MILKMKQTYNIQTHYKLINALLKLDYLVFRYLITAL
jgi:hypothetical protein